MISKAEFEEKLKKYGLKKEGGPGITEAILIDEEDGNHIRVILTRTGMMAQHASDGSPAKMTPEITHYGSLKLDINPPKDNARIIEKMNNPKKYV